MLRIGEFAQLSSISIHMLRNYDKIGLLVPRNVDQTSGYRYYEKEQLLRANQIIALKTMGFALDEIKEIMSRQSAQIYAFLESKLHDKLEESKRIQNQIRQLRGVLNSDQSKADYILSIAQKPMASTWVASIRDEIDDYPKEGILWGKLTSECQKNGIVVSEEAPAMAVYHGVNENTGATDVEVQFPISKKQKAKSPLSIFELPAKEVISIIFKGGYSQLGDINTLIAAWLEKNELEINGQAFTIYHNSPGNCTDNRAFITELCFPVQKK